MNEPIYDQSFVKTIRELRNGQSHTFVLDNSRGTIKRVRDTLYISPSDSVSIVCVRGRRIYEPTPLEKDDIITIGSLSLYTHNPERIPTRTLIELIAEFMRTKVPEPSTQTEAPPKPPQISAPEPVYETSSGVSLMNICSITILVVACLLLAWKVSKQSFIKGSDLLMAEAVESANDFVNNYSVSTKDTMPLVSDELDRMGAMLKDCLAKFKHASNSPFYKNSQSYQFKRDELNDMVQMHYQKLLDMTSAYLTSEDTPTISQKDLDGEINQWFKIYSDTPYAKPFSDLQSVWSVCYNIGDPQSCRTFLPILDALREEWVGGHSNALEGRCLHDLHELMQLCHVDDLQEEIDDQVINFKLIASENLLWRIYAYKRLYSDREESVCVPEEVKAYLNLESQPVDFSQLVESQQNAFNDYLYSAEVNNSDSTLKEAAQPLKETMSTVATLMKDSNRF